MFTQLYAVLLSITRLSDSTDLSDAMFLSKCGAKTNKQTNKRSSIQAAGLIERIQTTPLKTNPQTPKEIRPVLQKRWHSVNILLYE
jgi:hypothetical protein